MSLSYNGKSVIGGRFDTGVENQLKLRKEVINKVNTRSIEDIKYLTSTTGWVRVISSVDTFDKSKNGYVSETAKKFILQGGTPDSFAGFNPSTNTSSYNKQSEYGYIPTPGITSFQVMSKGTFGTLRTASFNFTVNSPEDFSKLEQLYLRPGFSILLEWGHSYYLSNTEKKLVPTTDIYPLEDFLRPSSNTVIESKIDSLKSTSNSFNYDALFGIIKNFIWNYNGYTYECQVDVISKGEIVESVKTAMAPLTKIKNSNEAQPGTEAANVKYTPSEYGSELLAYLKLIETGPTNILDILEYLNIQNKSLTEKIKSKYRELKKTFEIPLGGLTTNYRSKTGNKTKYISLRTLLILVNEISLPYYEENAFVAFNVGENSIINTFTTFDQHFGLDLGICILPKKSQSSFIYQTGTFNVLTSSIDILDIFVSVSFLVAQIKELELKSDVNATVYDFILRQVLGLVQENLGNINYFDIAEDTLGGETFLHIVDRKVIPSKNDIKTKLDLVGLASEVSNLNITSKISNNLSSMIAIAAQTTYSPSSAEDLYNMQKWNVGLKDRHLRKGAIGSITTTAEEGEIDPQEVVNIEIREKLKEYIEKINEKNTNGPNTLPDPSGLKSIHRQVMNELVRAQTNAPPATNPPGLIPFDLSFTIKGISGIKVGQAFTINDFFLPDRYKNRVGFIVTGVDHKVNNSIWTTDIRSQMIFI